MRARLEVGRTANEDVRVWLRQASHKCDYILCKWADQVFLAFPHARGRSLAKCRAFDLQPPMEEKYSQAPFWSNSKLLSLILQYLFQNPKERSQSKKLVYPQKRCCFCWMCGGQCESQVVCRQSFSAVGAGSISCQAKQKLGRVKVLTVCCFSVSCKSWEPWRYGWIWLQAVPPKIIKAGAVKMGTRGVFFCGAGEGTTAVA